MKKRYQIWWRALSFENDAFWSLNLKKNKDYTILIPQYFSI